VAGGILLFAGLQHFQNQFHFYRAVMSYGLTPTWASKTIAGVLPHLELLVGSFLVFRVFLAGAVPLAAAMWLAFFIATLAASIDQKRISCACFGTFDLPLTWYHVVLNGAISYLLLVSVPSSSAANVGSSCRRIHNGDESHQHTQSRS
jgi:hypothetical protein